MGLLIKRIFLGLFLLLVTISFAIFIQRRINHSKFIINNQSGIQENIYVKIGGIEQYMQIRGDDSKNPVILFIHGGPGYPLTYLSPWYNDKIEKEYTVVNWEQRGCGKTYYKNMETDLSIDQTVSDLDEVVLYLKNRFHQDSIVLIGQSWGTVPGVIYSSTKPENITAYIGVGQVTQFAKGKVFAAELAKKIANDKDREILSKNIKIFHNHKKASEINVKNIEEMILTSLKYLKGEWELPGYLYMWKGLSSPEMKYLDIKWFLNASDTKKIIKLQEPLIDYMYYGFNIEDYNNLDIPYCIIQGDSDYITPTKMVEDNFSNVKKIEGAGHTPFMDNPELYQKLVIEFLSS